MTYFYYEKTTTGKWSPMKSMRPPMMVSAEGRRFKITQITEIPPEHMSLSLDELSKLYPLKGEEA